MGKKWSNGQRRKHTNSKGSNGSFRYLKQVIVLLPILFVGIFWFDFGVAEASEIPIAADRIEDYESKNYDIELKFTYTDLISGEKFTKNAKDDLKMGYAYKGFGNDVLVGEANRFQWFMKDAQVHKSGKGLTFNSVGVSVNNKEYAIGSQQSETAFDEDGNWTYKYTGGGTSASNDFSYEFSIIVRPKIQKEGTAASVNVKDFGAVGDGKTDDTKAFKEAIQECAKEEVKKLVIPACENFYNVKEALIFTTSHNDLEVVGSGDKGPINLTSYTHDGHLIGVIGNSDTDLVEGIKMSNLELNVTYSRPESTTAPADNALGCSRVKNAVFDRITVKKSPWKGVTGQVMCKNVTFKNMDVSGCYKYGIGFEGHTVADVKIIDSISHNNNESGIYVGAGSSDSLLIDGAIIENCYTNSNIYDGISLSQCKNAQIIDCESRNNSAAGIKIANSLFTSVTNSDSSDNNVIGVYILGGSNNSIRNCVAANNSKKEVSPRGNFVTMNSYNDEFVDCKGDIGAHSFTNWSENTRAINCLF